MLILCKLQEGSCRRITPRGPAAVHFFMHVINEVGVSEQLAAKEMMLRKHEESFHAQLFLTGSAPR